jgi:Flp pilus assembly protein TadB
MFATNRDYIMLLFTSKTGLVMIGGAAFLLIAGVLWMKKIVNIDV